MGDDAGVDAGVDASASDTLMQEVTDKTLKGMNAGEINVKDAAIESINILKGISVEEFKKRMNLGQLQKLLKTLHVIKREGVVDGVGMQGGGRGSLHSHTHDVDNVIKTVEKALLDLGSPTIGGKRRKVSKRRKPSSKKHKRKMTNRRKKRKT